MLINCMHKSKQGLKMKKERKIDWWETIYLFLYGCILIHDFLDTTMFMVKWPPKFMLIFYFLIMIYSIAKFKWHNHYTRKEIMISAIILTTFTIAAVVADYSFLFEIAFLIVAAKDISADKILKIYVVIGTVILIAAFMASQMGWIENLQYWKGENMRFSFGIIYPTDFAAHIFYLILASVCICNRVVRIRDILLALFLAIFVYKEALASTSFLCIVVFAVMIFIFKLYLASEQNSIVEKMQKSHFMHLLAYAPVLFAGLFMIMAHMYNPDKVFWIRLDAALSERLKNSSRGIQEYGYKLFGQQIQEAGWGRSVAERTDYFFLDDSYIRIALEYGLIIFIVILCLYVFLSRKALKEGRVIMVIAIFMVAVHCFMEQHLLEVAYNPFFLLLFADMETELRY